MSIQKHQIGKLRSQVVHLFDQKKAAMKTMERSAKRAVERTANEIRVRPFWATFLALMIGILFGRVIRSRA